MSEVWCPCQICFVRAAREPYRCHELVSRWPHRNLVFTAFQQKEWQQEILFAVVGYSTLVTISHPWVLSWAAATSDLLKKDVLTACKGNTSGQLLTTSTSFSTGSCYSHWEEIALFLLEMVGATVLGTMRSTALTALCMYPQRKSWISHLYRWPRSLIPTVWKKKDWKDVYKIWRGMAKQSSYWQRTGKGWIVTY